MPWIQFPRELERWAEVERLPECKASIPVVVVSVVIQPMLEVSLCPAGSLPFCCVTGKQLKAGAWGGG